jgi:hypothetical protein
MFQTFDPFNISIQRPNDIVLSEDEYELVNELFLPKTKELELEGFVSENPNERLAESIYLSMTQAVRLAEARGRNRVIESTPTLLEIQRAIEKRKYVSIYYQHRNGEKGHRLIEPYAMGRGFVTNNGNIVNPNHIYIRAFVIMNTNSDKTTAGRFSKTKSVSVSDRRNRWRLFRLDRVLQWWDLGKTFSQYRRQYNPDDKQLATVLMSLQKSQFPKGENPKINW